jgi:hypothetical protein
VFVSDVGEIRGPIAVSDLVGTALLTGGSQKPNPVSTLASGSGIVVVLNSSTIQVSLAVTGLTPVAIHIHAGGACCARLSVCVRRVPTSVWVCGWACVSLLLAVSICVFAVILLGEGGH